MERFLRQPEPAWLNDLRAAIRKADYFQQSYMLVRRSDLQSAIIHIEDGPRGLPLVAAEDGKVVVGFQGLLKAVYFTPDEAREVAHVIAHHADEISNSKAAAQSGS